MSSLSSVSKNSPLLLLLLLQKKSIVTSMKYFLLLHSLPVWMRTTHFVNTLKYAFGRNSLFNRKEHQE
jgi:hypothetical protein